MQNFNFLQTLFEDQNLDFYISISDLDEGYLKPIYPNTVNNFHFYSEHKNSQNNLKSLEHCPTIINEHFYCSLSHITSLEYSPHTVNGDYTITLNEYLHSLQYCPSEINGNFNCAGSAITSLEFSPSKVNEWCYFNKTKITSLEYAPLIVGKSFTCNDTNIKDLKAIGRKYLREIGQDLYLPGTIESNILGLCLIKKVQEIKFQSSLQELSTIIKKHLHTPGDECAEELTQNGFNDYAKF